MSQAGKPSSSPFPATRWTLIQRAQKGGEKEAARAMEEICAQYWYPIYAFARRCGFGVADAEDLTQTFFQRLIVGETIKAAQQEKGLLRSFMLGLLKRVISNHHRHTCAAKRGGSSAATISFHEEGAEDRYAQDLASAQEPDALFDHAWAKDVLQTAERKLRQDYVEADNVAAFEQLREFLPLGQNATPYATVAKNIGVAEGTLRLQIHRMRKRYAKHIEEEIAQTVNGPAEVKQELAHLMAAVGK